MNTNQLLLGAAIPFVIGALIYVLRGGRASLTMLVAIPSLMALTALWAVLPDVPRLIGWTQLYARLAQDPRTNIFLWHYTIDRIETDAPWYIAAYLSAWVILAGGLYAAAWREVCRAEGS